LHCKREDYILHMQKLGEIAEISTGFPFDGHKYTSIGIRVVRGENIGQGELHWEEKVDKRWNESTSALDNYWLYEGDIVMQMDGNVGKNIARIYTADPMLIAQRVACIRAKEKCSQDYIYGILRTKLFKNYIERCATGTSIKHISLRQITDFEFDFHLPEIQAKLGKIIADVDDKIRVNRQINDNLEAMAKQLYDYWFVQFDFPNEEGKPYKSSGGAMVWNEKLKREIPEGWNVANVFDELSVQYGFPFSTELFTEEPTSIPVVRIRDILENSVSAYSEEEVDEKYKLQKQDLLVGMDGNFHMNYWNDNVSYLNQRSVRLRAKSKSTVSIMQAKYDIAPYIKAKELRAKGSTVGHLSDKDLKELFVLVCPNIDFRNKFDSILAEIIENRCEMIELTKQRDELLPLLMNGQASVNYHLSDD
jgi:restriction endonuclease S subunit